MSPLTQDAQERESPLARVAVISQDKSVCRALGETVNDLGAWLLTVTLDAGGDAALPEPAPSLVLLDMRGRGAEALTFIRARSDVPIVGVVDSGDAKQVAGALERGADDTVEWPCDPDLLQARIRNILRRTRRHSALVGPEGIELLPREHQVTVRGIRLNLTPREFAVLQLLLERRGEVLHADEISTTLWGHPTYGARNYVEAHVARARSKLRALHAENVIVTVRGLGYKIPR